MTACFASWRSWSLKPAAENGRFTYSQGRCPPQSSLIKHEHLIGMLSLGNAFDDAELAAWQERIVRLAGDDVRASGYTPSSRSMAQP